MIYTCKCRYVNVINRVLSLFVAMTKMEIVKKPALNINFIFFIKTNVRIKTRIKYMTKYDNKDLL